MYTYSVWRTFGDIKAQNRIEGRGKRKDSSPRVQPTFHSSEQKSSLWFEENLRSTQKELQVPIFKHNIWKTSQESLPWKLQLATFEFILYSKSCFSHMYALVLYYLYVIYIYMSNFYWFKFWLQYFFTCIFTMNSANSASSMHSYISFTRISIR